MRILLLNDIGGRFDLLEELVGRLKSQPPDAVMVIGELTPLASAPEFTSVRNSVIIKSYQLGLELLSRLGAPIYLIPGERAELLPLLAQAVNAHHESPRISLVQRNAARLGDLDAVAGFGGLRWDPRLPQKISLGALVPEWQARAAFEHLSAFNFIFQRAQRRIFLFSAPPRNTLLDNLQGEHFGIESLNTIIKTYQPVLVCCSGAERGCERINSALVVSPGSFAAGFYALITLETLQVTFEQLEWLTPARAMLAERHILVPLDRSALAEAILPQVKALAHALSAKIVLLHVMKDRPTQHKPVAAQAQQTHEQQLLYLQVLAEQLTSEGLSVSSMLRYGDPAMVIGDVAAHDPYVTMVAMATHGRSALGSMIFGSVIAHVLGRSSVPLLLLHPGEPAGAGQSELGAGPILVPLDRSSLSEQGLAQASSLAAACGAPLLLLAVAPALEDVIVESDGIAQSWFEAQLAYEAEQLERYLDEQAAGLEQAGLVANTLVASGDPATQILRVATAHQATLVVMGSHGRTGLRRLLLGSVALKVVQQSSLPVLLIRPPAAAAAVETAQRVADDARLPAGIESL